MTPEGEAVRFLDVSDSGLHQPTAFNSIFALLGRYLSHPVPRAAVDEHLGLYANCPWRVFVAHLGSEVDAFTKPETHGHVHIISLSVPGLLPHRPPGESFFCCDAR